MITPLLSQLQGWPGWQKNGTVLRYLHFVVFCAKIEPKIEKIQKTRRKQGPNVSTTPLRQWGFQQCLPFSWTTVGGKHCWNPIAVMGVVDMFGQPESMPNETVAVK